MTLFSQRDEFNSASAISVGLCCYRREKKRQAERERAHNKKDQQTEKKKKIIDGGRRGRRGGHRRIEKGGPCRTVLPKPRSIVMKMAVHMTTIAAE